MQTKQRVSAFFSLQVLKENLKSKTKLKLTTTTTRTATTKKNNNKKILDLISHPISELSLWQVCFEPRLFRHIDFCHFLLTSYVTRRLGNQMKVGTVCWSLFLRRDFQSQPAVLDASGPLRAPACLRGSWGELQLLTFLRLLRCLVVKKASI